MSYQRSRILASACACVLSMAAYSAFGQGAPATVTELEEVVVTGSFIKSTPEDQAMPVEVISYEELQDLGRPSTLDLVKTMSETGGVAGETNRVNFYPMGAATVNLRSLGARFTTVLFNGRRFPEQFSVNTGRFNNVSWIPNAAIGSVETLKAGGGVTYGADAVAGVQNYITRKDLDGLEVNADYRWIKDSDGDYNADALWGRKYDGGNVLVSLAYQHRSQLKEIDRPFSKYQYLENTASYTVNGNPGSYVIQTPSAGAQTSFTPTSGFGTVLNPALQYNGALHMGPTGMLRDPSCAALGGFQGWSATPNPVCYTNTAEGEDVVTESETFQFYIEHNHTFGNGVKLHSEGLAYKFAPTAALASTFGNNPGSWPLDSSGQYMQVINGTQTRVPAVTGPIIGGTGSNAYFVPGSNPAVAPLLNSLRNPDGSTAFTTAQITAIVAGGQIGLQNLVWRPFGVGGNPYPEGDIQKNDTRLWRISEAISGNLPEFWGTSLEWEVGLTYAHVYDVRHVKDILVDRLQRALNGLGGPNCSGTTPGANGCQYFNPFPSAFGANVFNGMANPSFVGLGSYPGYMPGQGLQNDPNLVKWLYVPIYLERIYNHYVFDPIIRGDTGISLPGGTIQMAAGFQFRLQTEDTILDDYSNRAINPCPTVGVTTCLGQTFTGSVASTSARIGPLALARPANVLGAAASNFLNEFRRFPVAAAFVEAQLPVVDSLNVTLASRYEKFYSDVSDNDTDVFIPAGGLKWQPLDWLGVRASLGKTFSQVRLPIDAPPIPGISAQSATFGIGGAGQTYSTNNYPNLDVEPERGTYLDFGFIVKAGNFAGNFDYYDIKIDNYLRTMTVAGLLSAVVQPGQTGSGALINCNSDLIRNSVTSLNGRSFVELNIPGGNANCATGGPGGTNATMAQLVGGNVNFFGANNNTNSGKLTSKGIDISASYRFDNVFGGSLTPSIDYSRILVWKISDFIIAGVKVADGYDGVGFTNSNSAKQGGQSVAEWRGTFGVTYRFDVHTLNIRASYIPGIINDSDGDYAVTAARNANIGTNGASTSGGTANPAVAATCASPALISNIGAVPAGAGTGIYGGPGRTSGTVGYCAAQNVLVDSGRTIDRNFNVDLIYRVQLPAEVGLTLTINNVLDEEPPFFRGIVAYNTAYGSPLGRNYKLGISKKF